MKVECINGDWNLVFNEINTNRPIKGEIYQVVDEEEFLGRKFYVLNEFRQDQLWCASHFKVIDDLDDLLARELNEINKELCIELL